MNNLLIIYPNWLPSNAVGVQRVRLIVNYIEEFGWKPVILSVKPEYYEEEKADELLKLVKPTMQIEYVDATKVKNLRLYGDIALRAFSSLKQKAIEIVKQKNINCVWVPIPPFYTALIGRKVHDSTGVPYVVDYIDPWVHEFPGSTNWFSRAMLASIVARYLEPIAVRKASALTGVASRYYLPVIERNPNLKGIPHKGMPYGFDPNDYCIKPDNDRLLWCDDGEVKPYVYAGAFLPQAHYFIEKLFQIISKLRKTNSWDKKIRLYFVGTGYTKLRTIEDYARKFGLSDIVQEKRERISYLEVLNNLSQAAGVLAIGSTEPHYTASKIFQALLSKKPVLAIFHNKSTAVRTLVDANADNYLVSYDEQENSTDFERSLQNVVDRYFTKQTTWDPQLQKLDKYSAKSSAQQLAKILDEVISK